MVTHYTYYTFITRLELLEKADEDGLVLALHRLERVLAGEGDGGGAGLLLYPALDAGAAGHVTEAVAVAAGRNAACCT